GERGGRGEGGRRVRSRSSTTSAGTAGRRRGGRSSHSASAWNQRRRSAYGTAAFAGDVEGRTKRPVSASVRGWTPRSGRSPNAPRYASLPTKAIARGRRS